MKNRAFELMKRDGIAVIHGKDPTSISHYLTIKDAVTMGEYIVRLLEQY